MPVSVPEPGWVKVEVRGEAYRFRKPATEDVHLMLSVALLALDDPRVDAVMRAFGLLVVDGVGRQMFPPTPERQ